MKICYLSPHLHRPHGGIRVIIEHCNHLAEFGHEVTLHVFGNAMTKAWCKISEKIDIRYGGNVTDEFEVVVATTPPLALVLDAARISAKKFYFLQMAEHLFVKSNKEFNQKAYQSYRVGFPIIGISRWVEYLVRTEGHRGNLPMYYVGNGVSADFVPGKKDEQFTVLVEGWESYGDSKDVNNIAPKVAKSLKDDFGVRILAYSQFPIKRNVGIPDEYYEVPTQEALISLYQRSHIILKASLLDARSCAPVEAMCCGCVPVRAIVHGDDDLVNGYNCLRSEYDEDALYRGAARLIQDKGLLGRLSKNGAAYAKQWLNWPTWMRIIEEIYKG